MHKHLKYKLLESDKIDIFNILRKFNSIEY